MKALEGLTERQAIVNSRFAYLGAVTAMSGIQLIAPSLPAMRDALGITDAQLALVTSLYLLPAAIAALPAGILADRIGRRKVFGWSFIVLGLAGAALQFASGSFGVFLAIRFIQGTAFAGLMPLTMTILGDAWNRAGSGPGTGSPHRSSCTPAMAPCRSSAARWSRSDGGCRGLDNCWPSRSV